MTWPLTRGGWCDDVMTGHARVTVTWHRVTNIPVTLAIIVMYSLSQYLHCVCAKRHDSLACVESQCLPPPHMWWWTQGAKVTHHPMPRTLSSTGHRGGNWCLGLGMCIHIMGLFTMARYYRGMSEQQLTIIGLSSPFHNLTVSRHWYGDG